MWRRCQVPLCRTETGRGPRLWAERGLGKVTVDCVMIVPPDVGEVFSVALSNVAQKQDHLARGTHAPGPRQELPKPARTSPGRRDTVPQPPREARLQNLVDRPYLP